MPRGTQQWRGSHRCGCRRTKQASRVGKQVLREVEDTWKKKGFKSEMGTLKLRKTMMKE